MALSSSGISFEKNPKQTSYVCSFNQDPSSLQESSDDNNTITAYDDFIQTNTSPPSTPPTPAHNEKNNNNVPTLPTKKVKPDIKFKISICRVKNFPGMKGLLFKRMKGDMWQYKAVVEYLMQNLKLN